MTLVRKILIPLMLCIGFCITASAKESVDSLADAIAARMGKEPYVVRVLYGEMLLNRLESTTFPDTLDEVSDAVILSGKANDSDRRAAAAALRGFGFAGGALYVAKWSEIENTPLMMRSGVRLYDWFFYI